jgi:hypothetical protein
MFRRDDERQIISDTGLRCISGVPYLNILETKIPLILDKKKKYSKLRHSFLPNIIIENKFGYSSDLSPSKHVHPPSI